MEPQTVHCPVCQALVPADNINIAALVAKCANCNHVFSLPLAPASAASAAPPAAPPICPRGIVCETGPDGELYIRRRWFQPMFIFLLVFCIVWDLFLVGFYSAMLLHPPKGNQFWLAVLFPTGHLAVGLGLTYFVAAGFLNTTRILIDRDAVHVRHRPLPWPGNRDLARMDIRGIDATHGLSSNHQRLFKVRAELADGGDAKLISNVGDRHARFVGYRIADYLNVPFRDGTVTFDLIPSLPRWARKWVRVRRR